MAMELYAPETLTVQACKEWALALESEWGAGASGTFQKGLDREEQLYFQDFGVQVPEGAPGVKTGSAPADADAAVDSITPYDVQIFVRPARAKKKYATQADVLTRFGHGLLFDWRRPVDLFALLSFDMVVRRVAIARVLYDDTVWAARDDTRHAGESDEDYADRQDDWDVRHRWQNPIVLERRSPRFTKWRRTERGQLLCVTETYQITIAEARATFAEDEAMQDRLRQITQGMEPHQSVEVQDIWVGAHRCILVRDMEVFPEGVREHGYPEIPYVIMPFRETSFEAPGDRYRGMLTNAGGLYEAESQLLSMHMAQLAWNAWRTWTGWVGDENKDVVIKPGDFLHIDRRKGHYIEMLQGEAVPPELAQTVGMLDTFLQRNSVAGGPRGGADGTRSAQQVWAIQSQRQLKLEPGKQAFRQGVQDMLRLAAIILETMCPEPLTLPLPGRDQAGEPRGEVTVKPGDINGYYNGFEVNFGRRLDPALLEQAKALQVFATNNWMPLHESWRLSGLTDNPQEWEDMLLQQNIERLPWVIELAALTMCKAYFGKDSPEYLRLMEKIEEQQPGGGAPGGPPTGGAPGQPPGGGGGLEPPSGAPQRGTEGGGGNGAASGLGPGMGHQRNSGRPMGGSPPPGVSGGTAPGQTRGQPGY
jgi:hypothetical protein